MEIREKIIYAPGANESELLRSLAKRGEKTFGLRVMGTRELVSFLMERNGVTDKRMLLPDNVCAGVVYSILKGIRYFDTVRFTDAQNFISSMAEFRMNLDKKEDAEKIRGGAFEEKNEAVLTAYRKYLAKMEAENYADLIMRMNFVIEKGLKSPVDIYVLKEFPLKPLEEKLYESATGHEMENYQEFPKNYRISEYDSFYGEKAEAEYVLAKIAEENIPLDEVTVAVSDVKYRRIFEDVAQANNVNVTFGIPVSVSETNPGKMLRLVTEWKKSFWFKDALHDIVYSEYFDKDRFLSEKNLTKDYLEDVIKMAGGLRLNPDKKKNLEKIERYEELLVTEKEEIRDEKKKLAEVRKLAETDSFRLENLLSYTKLSSFYTTRDEKALSDILQILSYEERFGVPQNELLEEAMAIVCSSKVSEEGALYVTTIGKAKSVLRKHLFILGLSADVFPGSAKEDYLILDSDYELIGKKEKSAAQIEEKKQALYDLLALNAGNDITLSYPSFSTGDLKGKNASSMLYEICKKTEGEGVSISDFEKKIVRHDYFSSMASASCKVEKAYAEGESIAASSVLTPAEYEYHLNEIGKSFSATALDVYFRCPYKFYLEKILGFESGFVVSPTDPMDAAAFGTAIHDALENLDKNIHSLDDFKAMVNKSYHRFIVTNPPLSAALAEKRYEELMQVAENAYNLASFNQKYIAEEDIGTTHIPSGLKIHGFPDRAEITPEGKIKVIDYKAKSHQDHDGSDYDTCAQVMAYAYIINHEKHLEIDSCEYRYLKLNQNFTVDNLEACFVHFDAKMIQLAEDLKTGMFKKKIEQTGGREADVCKYCIHKNLCMRNLVTDTEGEDD